ncbi:MAG: chromate resistance protein ChrB [Actinomycetota bacterium]|nr:chromate resistance protein ChrB [Actinomycetota bacterium]
MNWRVFTYRMAADQSRHRVGVWRELRRIGAVSLQQGTWAIPQGKVFDEGLQRALELVERGGGRPLVLDVVPSENADTTLQQLFGADREDEWSEFCAECDKCEAELQSEIDKKKFTHAELDEEEHNVERLRRWHREIEAKDLFGSPSAMRAGQRLKECGELLDRFAEQVFEAGERD